MPGIITHYICGEAVLKKLRKGADVIKANRQVYNMGTQGPDIFFYCLPLFMRKSLNNIGTLMHNKSFGTFVENMLDGITRLDKKERGTALSYLSGFLTHYCLDSKTHPYIYYKSGFKKKGDKIKAIKHSVNHRSFETAIDVLMLKLISSERPSHKKLWQLIYIDRIQALAVSKIISNSLNCSYRLPVTTKQVYKAFSYTLYFTRIMQSNKGAKKRIFEFVEDAVFGERIFSSLIHGQDIKDGIDYLNCAKKEWCMPWDKACISRASFPEMFMESSEQAALMIEALFDWTCGKLSKRELLSIIGNNSLKTGQDSCLNLKFKYSEI